MHSFTKLPILALGAIALISPVSPALAGDTGAELDPPVISDQDFDQRAFLLAEAIVEKGYPEDQREALFFGTMDQTVEQMRSALGPSLPEDDAGAIDIFDQWVAKYTEESKQVLRKHIPSIMAGMTEAYAKIFSVEELSDILAFVETPSGQKFFELSPAVMGDPSFADANQRYLDESMELLSPAQQELLSDLRAYMMNKDGPEGTQQI